MKHGAVMLRVYTCLAEQMDSLAMPVSISTGGIEADTFTISSFGDRTRGFLKAQDGCDIGCLFCINPLLRQEPRDKTRDATALTEAIRSRYWSGSLRR